MKKKMQLSGFDWILIGLTLHSVGGEFFNSSKVICYVLCGTGLFIIVFYSLFKMQFVKPFYGFTFYLFVFYLIWSAFIIARPFFSPDDFSMNGFSFINRYTFLSLTTPLVIFLGFRQISITHLFSFCMIQVVIGFVLIILNYHYIFAVTPSVDSDDYQSTIDIIDIPLQFLFVSSFLILCYPFVLPKYLIAGLSGILLSILIVLFTARRGNLFMYLLILLLAVYLYVFASKKGSKVLKISIITVIVLIGTLIFNLYANSTFSFFLSRLDEDTRSGVEGNFYYSFHGKVLDWLVGRGINGVYSPIYANLTRDNIETGYLQLILKGGIIYLALFVFFLAHSAWLGLFRTKNMLTKGMALYLIAHIIYLAPFGLPAFNFEYVVVWVCVFYCQSERFRYCPDKTIKLFLNVNKI